jgi:hypothetical protein
MDVGDLVPTGLSERRGEAMLGGDARFRMEPGEHVPAGGSLQPFRPQLILSIPDITQGEAQQILCENPARLLGL